MSDDDTFKLSVISFVLGGTIAFTATFITVGNVVEGSWERKLIKEHHGEYYLDANNERQFRLIPVKVEVVR